MIGKTLAHYEIIGLLGKGGMGEVYRARDRKLGREVALKILPADVAGDPGRLERFQSEAKIVAGINHPHIVTLHSVERDAGLHFLTMELVEGKGLNQLIVPGGLPLPRVIEISSALAEALVAAHAKGIVHRDLKPANVMVNDEGRVKVLDFGLAKLAAGFVSAEGPTQAADVTSPGAVVGTLRYMSPEQALGKEVDARSDIFSMGALMYEALTGKHAFAGESSAAVYDAILNVHPPALVELAKDVPAEFERIISKALEKDCKLRYQSAGELLADLRRFQRDSGTGTAVSHGARGSGSSGWQRRPVVVAAILLILTIVSWQLRPETKSERGGPGSPHASIAVGGPSIAILPLSNASGDPTQDFFSAGLTEDIITELGRYRELSVIAYSSTSRYKDSTADVVEVGQALGARYVLKGSVRRAGERIKLSVELSDAIDRTMVWGDSFERDLTASGVFELQDELTLKVVNAIAATYGAVARAELPRTRHRNPANLDSYDCVLRAYSYLQIHNAENHLAALECLETVVESDPGYVDGRAWLGYIYADSWHHRWNEPTDFDARDRALELTREAARLDPANHVAHGALALTYFFLGESERAKSSALRTIELAPNNTIWLSLVGTYLAQQGEFGHALPMIHKAMELDPFPPRWIRMALFHDRYHHGDYEGALVEAKSIELDGDFREPLFRAACYGQLDQPDLGRRYYGLMLQLWGRPEEELRQDLIERHAYSAPIVDELLAGLQKVK